MSMTLFKLTIMCCLFDFINLPYLGTIFDTMPCGVQFWFWALIITGVIGFIRKEYGPMGYSDILATFLKKFPQYTDEVVQWAPAGKNAIKVKLRDGSGLTFTYTDDIRWNLNSDVSFYGRRG